MNRAKLSKRVIAYIIDFIFILSILMIIYSLFLKTNEIKSLEQSLNTLTELLLKGIINVSEYFNSYSTITYELDYLNIKYLVISMIISILYYIVLVFILKGKTLGKSIMKIKIVANNKQPLLKVLLIRCLVINNLGYTIISLILLNITSNKVYFILLSILTFLQLLLVIISGIMVLYKKDKRSLEDILSRSEVISLN